MLTKLLFASLLALSPSTLALADAPTKAPLPPPTKGCLVTANATTPVFQIERKRNKRDVDAQAIDTKLSIVSNGAWTYTETKVSTNTVVRTEAGCLSAKDLATLETSLATATWKTSRADAVCEVYALDYFEYSYRGKSVLKSAMCDGLILDKATEKALAGAHKITNPLLPKAQQPAP